MATRLLRYCDAPNETFCPRPFRCSFDMSIEEALHFPQNICTRIPMKAVLSLLLIGVVIAEYVDEPIGPGGGQPSPKSYPEGPQQYVSNGASANYQPQSDAVVKPAPVPTPKEKPVKGTPTVIGKSPTPSKGVITPTKTGGTISHGGKTGGKPPVAPPGTKPAPKPEPKPEPKPLPVPEPKPAPKPVPHSVIRTPQAVRGSGAPPTPPKSGPPTPPKNGPKPDAKIPPPPVAPAKPPLSDAPANPYRH
ncbi:hypothetical protein RB195_002925 [Necator americanus]|uniref:Uncharacterized protein n=1 Tax=Necator americanus TaxID=51031 RepID=A0ABR1DP38_NECAM